MLTPQKLKAVEELVGSFNEGELTWLHGYVAGLLAKPQSAEPATSTRKITITYGTETGNSKKLAAELAARARKTGIVARLVGLDQYRLNELPNEEYFFAIVSTQGEGDPPAAARKFYEYIHGHEVELKRLNYGVLALGDTSYPLFCKAGEDVDIQLGKLGGRRLVPLQKCDTDYAADAAEWIESVLEGLQSAKPAPVAASVAPRKTGGKKIYRGVIQSIINLNDYGSDKETYHIEIGAEGVDYAPGDALGIVPANAVGVVEEVMGLCPGADERLFAFRNERLQLATLLHRKLHISYLPERTVARYAALVGQTIPATRMSLSDLLRIYPLEPHIQIEQLVEILEPMAPRLYSIASAPEAHPGQLHLTVARERFLRHQEWKQGLCSGYLSTLGEGDEIDFYIHHNERFRLPQAEQDVIMIGPGTGIAPFRSFLAQRDATGATGRNWLFFGDRYFVTDFLYQSELLAWLELGVLTHLDVAFSRDQPEKIYVQHEMRRAGERLYEWLGAGARLYVCGSKDPMSIDVEDTLVEIVEEHGKKSRAEALQFIETLKEEERYLKDVY